jgi:hypothetical protein
MDSLGVPFVKTVPLRQEDHMANSCEHLEGLSAKDFPPQKTPGACEECLTEGTVWVALRECQSCGHVGCCDPSTGKHANRHFQETQHPVMRCPACGLDMVLCPSDTGNPQLKNLGPRTCPESDSPLLYPTSLGTSELSLEILQLLAVNLALAGGKIIGR